MYRTPQKNHNLKPYVAKKMTSDPDYGCVVCFRTNCPRHGERAKEQLGKCNHADTFIGDSLSPTLVNCTVCGLDPLAAFVRNRW